MDAVGGTIAAVCTAVVLACFWSFGNKRDQRAEKPPQTVEVHSGGGFKRSDKQSMKRERAAEAPKVHLTPSQRLKKRRQRVEHEQSIKLNQHSECLDARDEETAPSEQIRDEMRRARAAAEKAKEDMKRPERERELRKQNEHLQRQLDEQKQATEDDMAEATRKRDEAQRALQREEIAHKVTDEELDLAKDEIDRNIKKQSDSALQVVKLAKEEDAAPKLDDAMKKQCKKARSKMWAYKQCATRLGSAVKRIEALGSGARRLRYEVARLERRAKHDAKDRSTLSSHVRLERARRQSAEKSLAGPQSEHAQVNTSLVVANEKLEAHKREAQASQQTIRKLQARMTDYEKQKSDAAAVHQARLNEQQIHANARFSKLAEKYQQQDTDLDTANDKIGALSKDSIAQSIIIADLQRQLKDAKKRKPTTSSSTQTEDGSKDHSGHNEEAKSSGSRSSQPQQAESVEAADASTRTAPGSMEEVPRDGLKEDVDMQEGPELVASSLASASQTHSTTQDTAMGDASPSVARNQSHARGTESTLRETPESIPTASSARCPIVDSTSRTGNPLQRTSTVTGNGNKFSDNPPMVTYDRLRAAIQPEGSKSGVLYKQFRPQLTVEGNEQETTKRRQEFRRMLDVIATHEGESLKQRKYYLKPNQTSHAARSQASSGSAAQNQPQSGSTSWGLPTYDEIRASIPSEGTPYGDLYDKFVARLTGSGDKKRLLELVKEIATMSSDRIRLVTLK